MAASQPLWLVFSMDASPITNRLVTEDHTASHEQPKQEFIEDFVSISSGEASHLSKNKKF